LPLAPLFLLARFEALEQPFGLLDVSLGALVAGLVLQNAAPFGDRRRQLFLAIKPYTGSPLFPVRQQIARIAGQDGTASG